ncbi:DUF1178 family protein [Microvirga pudoricolor]|uniref:DUF1178 family protein n=1 Tax=Microvirga pudoricolor TaxID=2778729 RepID=UPI00194EF34E|nr:DUF1178 family protein [Microvirga pudoricolor]MBM6593400.1 DUF1178 family protein [Microvirga pudoricolor]
MIKYALACEQAHAFESWFPSSDAYEAQLARGLVTCPVCHSPQVEKQIMAPSIARMDKPPMAVPAQPVAAISDKEREIRSMLRAMRDHVVQNAENVGHGFAEEARKMHYGEAEQRSIYGEAAPAEARALVEEGIDVLPLPVMPDDRN